MSCGLLHSVILAFVSVTPVAYAKTAERIDILFGVETPGDPENIVLYWGPYPSQCGGGASMQPLPNYVVQLFL